jgi:formamidopyrimidine-DNA glycosylase
MPELPEVETIRVGLLQKIIGLKIEKVEVISLKSFIGQVKALGGQEIKSIWRKAKILGIDLSSGNAILIHLKMSGQLIWVGQERFIGGHPTPDMVGELPNKSTRVIFNFSDGSKLYFNDQRRFGWIRVVNKDELQVLNELTGLFGKLGPEPLEKSFSWQILKQNLLRHKSMPVKVAILDQSVVSGVGNIYASESCFNAKLDPRKKVLEMTDQDFKSLHLGIIKALRAGIKYGGSTRTHFVDAQGRKGYFLDYAYVYGKDKNPCKICHSEIKKIQLRGRGTYFCPTCQKT